MDIFRDRYSHSLLLITRLVCARVNKLSPVHRPAKGWAVSLLAFAGSISIWAWIIHIFDLMYISNSSWACLISHMYDNGRSRLCHRSADLKPGGSASCITPATRELRRCRRKGGGRRQNETWGLRDGWRKGWGEWTEVERKVQQCVLGIRGLTSALLKCPSQPSVQTGSEKTFEEFMRNSWFNKGRSHLNSHPLNFLFLSIKNILIFLSFIGEELVILCLRWTRCYFSVSCILPALFFFNFEISLKKESRCWLVKYTQSQQPYIHSLIDCELFFME